MRCRNFLFILRLTRGTAGKPTFPLLHFTCGLSTFRLRSVGLACRTSGCFQPVTSLSAETELLTVVSITAFRQQTSNLYHMKKELARKKLQGEKLTENLHSSKQPY